MSCHGSCRTPLLEVNIAHVVSMDDFGSPANPLHSRVEVFVRVYRWELDVAFRKPLNKLFINRHGYGNIPRLFRFDASSDTMDAKQYSGDFTEQMHDDPYYGQRPR